jgi:NADH dehydrogenase
MINVIPINLKEMKKYIIVTGANGYLGKYVILEAIRQGYSVIGFKFNHIRSVLVDNVNVNYVHCDITRNILSQPGVEEAIAGKTVIGIVNAAALLGSSNINDNRRVNAHGVERVIELASVIGVKKIVQISSVVVLKKIKGPYGITKLEGQNILTSSGMDYTVFIPALILGPESLGINRILKNVFRFPFFVPLIGDGHETQHPIFVKDFASAIVKSLEDSKASFKVYEIAGDQVISFKNLIRTILKIRQKKKVFITVPVFIATWLGKFFQATQKVPVFTAEHVKGILQDSKLHTSVLHNDLQFKPTSMENALRFTLKEIGDNWQYYLSHQPERTIKPE